MKVAVVNLAVNTSLKGGTTDVTRVLNLRLESADRYAIMSFVNGQFAKCEYGGMDMSSPSTYTYNDYVFLGELSKVAQDIQCEFEVVRSGITGAMDCSKIVGTIRDINPDSFKVD